MPLYRLGFWHNICPASTPEGNTAIYGEVAYNPKKTSLAKAQALTADTKAHILNFLKLKPHHIVAEKVLTIKHAYVIYDAWRQKNVPKILTLLRNEGIHSIGRYGAWKYSGMQEAVLDGKATAEAVARTLQRAQHHIMPAQRDIHHRAGKDMRKQPPQTRA
jgi:hypothetical protein